LPSLRRAGVFVRTTTARTTAFFLILLPGITAFTLQMMTSPRPAVRRLEPPRTLMHITSLAPVLSATAIRVSCWIMMPSSLGGLFHALDLGDFRPGLLGLGDDAL